MNRMSVVIVYILAILFSVAICTSKDLPVESRDIAGMPRIGPESFMSGNQVGLQLGANLTMGSVECPSIRRVIVWVNDERKGDWDGTSEIPEIKVKLGDIIDMKICCNNNHYSCPATLSVWDLEGKLLPINKIPAYKVNCVQLKSKVQNKIKGTAVIKMSIFADCQQGCGMAYDMLHFSSTDDPVPNQNIQKISNWLVGDLNEDGSVSDIEVKKLQGLDIVSDSIKKDAKKNYQGNSPINKDWIVGDLNLDNKVSTREVNTIKELWSKNLMSMQRSLDAINNWQNTGKEM